MARLLDSVHGNNPDDFQVAVYMGLVPGWSGYRKFGYNPSVDSTTELIWSYGGLRTQPTTAGAATVVSTSVNDDGSPAGTGAWTVTIEGLDANYDQQTETLTLNGTTPVVGTKTWIRISRMYCASGFRGANNSNAGAITCSVGGNVQCNIPVGLGQTQICADTVPRGMRLVVTGIQGASSRIAGSADCYLAGSIRLIGDQVWRTIYYQALYQNNISSQLGNIILPEKTDYRIMAVTTATAEVSATLAGYLVKDGFYGK